MIGEAAIRKGEPPLRKGEPPFGKANPHLERRIPIRKGEPPFGMANPHSESRIPIRKGHGDRDKRLRHIGHLFLLKHTSLIAVPQHRRRLELCVERHKDRCSSRRLQLNQNKTELIRLGSKSKLKQNPQTISHDPQYLCSVVVEPTDSVSAIWASPSKANSMRQRVGKLPSICLRSPPSPVPVPVDARPVVVTTTRFRFCIHSITRRLLQRRARRPSSLHACTSSARPAARSVADLLARVHVTDFMQSLRTFAPDRLSNSLQAVSCEVRSLQRHQGHPASHTQLPESRCFPAAVGSEPPTPASLTYLAPEQNAERELSLWQVDENGTLCQPRSETPPKYLRFDVQSKYIYF